MAGVVALGALCSVDEPQACPKPSDGTEQAVELAAAPQQAGFKVLYPCQLPNTEELSSVSVTGDPGKKSVSLAFRGPFELSVNQSQAPPAFSPDPAGTSRTSVTLSLGVVATLLERVDGSPNAQYHLFWQKDDIFYEVIAIGPPLQRRQVLLVASSLE